MTYLEYVIAAYAVFAVVLAWDFAAPLLRTAGILRRVRQRAQRERGQTAREASNELSR